MHTISETLWPWIGLFVCVAIVALVALVGHRWFSPTCNRCPMCGRVTGTPASLLPNGDPYVCGHDVCDACLAEARRRMVETL
jgi:hypothetical protein